MNFEVEKKFPVVDLSSVENLLRELGATIQDAVQQIDTYFAHPARDFAATDEALRIRRVGHRNFVTYKGPKIDATTKTRRELELPLPDGDEGAQRFAQLFQALGFNVVADVRKSRRVATFEWQGRTVEIALDQVDRVGEFVELELVADEQTLEEAKACVNSFAERLGLSGSQRASYLELLIARGE